MADTEDLVQETLLNAVRNLPQFEMRHRFSLQAYMKRAAQNRIHDEIKRAARQGCEGAINACLTSQEPNPERRAISREELSRCRVALARLRPPDRRLILLAFAGGHSAKTLAGVAGKPSPDAVRVALSRALMRLAAEMERLES